MKGVVLSRTTELNVNNYLKSPSSVIIITGNKGAGKHFLAEKIAADLLGISYEKLSSYPYLIQLEPENNYISIDSIRQLQKELVRVVPGENQIRQVIIINNAHKLGQDAQNILLKTLEETKEATVFILCMPKISDVLETVASRAREICIHSVSQSIAEQYFVHNHRKEEIQQAYRLGNGHMGLMSAILQGEHTDLTDAIDDVKHVLTISQYDKLLEVSRLVKDKDKVMAFLDAFSLLAHASVRNTLKLSKVKDAARWQAISKQVSRAQKSLDKNASPKLVLTDLFLNI